MRRYDRLTFAMALPRSRTAWMAQTFGELVAARHEPLRFCASIAELQHRVDDRPMAQRDRPLLLVDTAAAFFFQEITERFPGARRIFIERNPDDVRRSLERLGLGHIDVDLADAYLAAARKAARADNLATLRLRFEDLDSPAILEHAARFIGYDRELPPGFWKARSARNIQAPLDTLTTDVDPHKRRALFASRRDL